MEKIFENLVNDAQFAKFFLTNTRKYHETTEDLSSDSPKYSSPFASPAPICQNFTPSIFFRVRYLHRSTVISIFPEEFCTHWVNEKTLSAQIMYGAPVPN